MWIDVLIIEDEYLPGSQLWIEASNGPECMRAVAFAMVHSRNVYRKTASGDIYLLIGDDRANLRDEYIESAVLLEAQRD